jgi:tRNA(Arg) A34 adenosine deaminase TadA
MLDWWCASPALRLREAHTVMSEGFMLQAIELALENIRQGRGGPFAALVVRRQEVIGQGTNLVTSANDPTAHAEITAIRDACRRLASFQLSGCEIYTTCEPCPMCLGAIYWARPERVYFACESSDAAEAGFDDSFIYSQIALPRAERGIPMSPMLREEARRVFAEWARIPDKHRY